MKQIDLNDAWLFYEGNEAMSFSRGQKEGKTVNLPHDFIVTKPRTADAAGGAGNGYFGEGEGIYKKDLKVPAEWQGKTVLLDIDGAYMNTEVMLNNELLALHPYGYTPFLVDLSRALQFDGKRNRLKIITQSRQPSSRWYSGGGLYRSVSLWVGNPIHIRPWDVFVTTVRADEKEAEICMKIQVTNLSGSERQTEIRGEILDPAGKVVANVSQAARLSAGEPGDREEGKAAGQERYTANSRKSDIAGTTVELHLKVEHPSLWEPDSPALYTWRVSVEADGESLDMAEDTFGIRTIAISVEHGFQLNGKSVKLKGGCIHHDNGLVGACAYPKAEERKIRILKSVGYNAVRISHYPPSSAMLRACDRLGMLLLDEAFDVWRLSKVPLDYHLYFEDWWERDIEAMVLRDRNHPCVITYSIGNEIGERDGKSEGARWSAKLAAKVRSLDSTRFVLSALCGIFPDPEEGGTNFEANLDADNQENDVWADATEEFVKPLDIVGYNYLYQRYEKDHVRYPERIMMGTETHSYTTWENWQAVMAHPYVLGDFIWGAVDYLGEVGVGKVYWEKDAEPFQFMTQYPWRTSWQSDIDLTGEQRPQSKFREIMWGRRDKAALYTTHPKHYGENSRGTGWHWDDVAESWTFEEAYIGSMVKAEVYGAGDEAEFLLNGKSLGRAPFEKMKAVMDVPYEKGTLEAVVYEAGQEISRASLQTVEAPVKLALRAEEDTVLADGRDLCYIHVDLVDGANKRHPFDERKLTCQVEGVGGTEGAEGTEGTEKAEAELIVIGSGNPCTEDPIGADWCHAFHGTAVVILKAAKPGIIRVSVSAEGVEAGSIEIQAK